MDACRLGVLIVIQLFYISIRRCHTSYLSNPHLEFGVSSPVSNIGQSIVLLDLSHYTHARLAASNAWSSHEDLFHSQHQHSYLDFARIWTLTSPSIFSSVVLDDPESRRTTSTLVVGGPKWPLPPSSCL